MSHNNQAYTIHGTDKTAKVASETDIAGSIRTTAPGRVENSSTTVVATLTGNGDAHSGFKDKHGLVPCGIPGTDVGYALRSNASHSGDKGDGGINTTLITHSLCGDGFDASEDGTGRGTPLIADCLQERDSKGSDSNTKNGHLHPSQDEMAVRRLTPRECERLQGFPDDYTLIPYRNNLTSECPDGPRYKALGNSMAVPVMRWIGIRIKQTIKTQI